MKKILVLMALFALALNVGCPAPEEEGSTESLCDADKDGFDGIICGGDDCNDDDDTADDGDDADAVCGFY